MYTTRLIAMALALAITTFLCPNLSAQDSEPITFKALMMEKGTKREILVPGQSVIVRHTLPNQKPLRGYITAVGESELVVGEQKIALQDVTKITVRDYERQRIGIGMTLAGIFAPLVAWTGVSLAWPDPFQSIGPERYFRLSRTISSFGTAITVTGLTVVATSQHAYKAKKWQYSTSEIAPSEVN